MDFLLFFITTRIHYKIISWFAFEPCHLEPPGAGLTIFVAILPNFVTGVLRLARDMQTLNALFGQWHKNFRNLGWEKGLKKMSKEICPTGLTGSTG
jgi:hypothetical protein